MRFKQFIFGVIVVLAPLLSGTARAQEKITLKLATIAPESSPWGKVFKIWQRAVSERSKQMLEIEIYYGSSKGETEMVANMRGGQIHGAALTSTGLGDIDVNALVMQMPGVFKSWDQLDAVREKVRPTLAKRFSDKGFIILGWGDIGEAHFMSYGYQAKRPSDLLPGAPGAPKLFAVKGDPILPILFEVLGIKKREMEIPEILPELTSHHVNAVTGPSLGAEQLQWTPNLDQINARVTGYVIGAIVFSKAKFDSLPKEMQTILTETGQVTGAELSKRIRGLDKEAYGRISKKLLPYDLNDAEAQEWDKVFAQVRAKLRGAVFDAALFDAVMNGAK